VRGTYKKQDMREEARASIKALSGDDPDANRDQEH
jgi:hypothetical protein